MGRRKGINGAEHLTAQLCAAHEAELSVGISSDAPLPPMPLAHVNARSYYAQLLHLVLVEAMAMVADGLSSARGRGRPLRLTLDEAVRASDSSSGGSRLGHLCFTHTYAKHVSAADRMRPGTVLLLASHGAEVLGVVDGRDTSWVEVLDSALLRCAAASLASGATWTATPVTSVLCQQRCIEVCLRRPAPPFLPQLLGGRRPAVATHTRFVDEEEDEEEESVGETSGAAVRDGATQGPQGAAAADAVDAAVVNDANDAAETVRHGDLINQVQPRGARELNECQHRVVSSLVEERAADALALLQGPPGQALALPRLPCVPCVPCLPCVPCVPCLID